MLSLMIPSTVDDVNEDSLVAVLEADHEQGAEAIEKIFAVHDQVITDCVASHHVTEDFDETSFLAMLISDKVHDA